MLTPKTKERIKELRRTEKRMHEQNRRDKILLKMAKGIPLDMLTYCEIIEKRRQSGRVITKNDTFETKRIFSCPDCAEGVIYLGDDYCPNCGLKLKWSKSLHEKSMLDQI